MTHNELLAALEAATEPSRELDAEIAKALGWIPESRLNDPDWWVRQDGVRLSLPCFTSSLDAAMTLVPEEDLYVELEICKNYSWVYVEREDEDGVTIGQWLGRQKLAAIALCIAALKAHFAQEKPE